MAKEKFSRRSRGQVTLLIAVPFVVRPRTEQKQEAAQVEEEAVVVTQSQLSHGQNVAISVYGVLLFASGAALLYVPGPAHPWQTQKGGSGPTWS